MTQKEREAAAISLFSGAKTLLCKSFYPMSHAVVALSPRFFSGEEGRAHSVYTMAVDKAYRCYVNLDYVEFLARMAAAVTEDNPCPVCGDTYHLETAYIAGVIAHEAQHLLREHHKECGDRKASTWNIAADYELNDDLEQLFKVVFKDDILLARRMCLPPSVSAVAVAPDGGLRSDSWGESVWVHMEEHNFLSPMSLQARLDAAIEDLGEGNASEEVVGALIKNLRSSHRTTLMDCAGPFDVTVRYDGTHFHVKGDVQGTFNRGDRVDMLGHEVVLGTNLPLLPRAVRERSPKHGSDFVDGELASWYYYETQDLCERIKNDALMIPRPPTPEKHKFDRNRLTTSPVEVEADLRKAIDSEADLNIDHDGEGVKVSVTLAREAEEYPGPFLYREKGDTCGSGADGKSRDYDEEGGITPAEARILKEKVAEEILDHQAKHGHGSVPGGMSSWADNVLDKPKVGWKRLLQRQMRVAGAKMYGKDQRSWHRFGNASMTTSFRVLYPTTYSPQPHVVAVLDTSASMGFGHGTPLHAGISEVAGICKKSGARVTLLNVDAAVCSKEEVTSVKRTKIQGGGGTDMTLGIEAAQKIKDSKICVVITDGGTHWPKTKPKGMEVIAVIVGTNQGVVDRQAAHVPNFIRTIKAVHD